MDFDTTKTGAKNKNKTSKQTKNASHPPPAPSPPKKNNTVQLSPLNTNTKKCTIVLSQFVKQISLLKKKKQQPKTKLNGVVHRTLTEQHLQ